MGYSTEHVEPPPPSQEQGRTRHPRTRRPLTYIWPRSNRVTVVGNHHDKHSSPNPGIRWLTDQFVDRLGAVLDQVAAASPRASVLEVGCGEGFTTGHLVARWDRVVAIDLPVRELRAEWAARTGPAWLHADAEHLPFSDDQFDIGIGSELLEHLEDPQQGLAELARVCRRHLVLSVPREPLFRLGNLVAWRHVRAMGNTPGHVQHWSQRSFVRLLEQVGTVRLVEAPLPWTICWVELPVEPPSRVAPRSKVRRGP